MKCQYRKRTLCYENKFDFNFTLLDASNVIKVAWDKVSKETVVNCFRHCLASDSSYEPTEQKDFGNIFDKLLLFIQVPKEVSFSNFIEVDDDLPTTAKVSEVDILKMFRECNGNDEYKNVNSSSVVVVPTHKEAIQALNTVHLFLQTHNGFKNLISPIESIIDDLILQMITKLKQVEITDFLEKPQ